MKKLLLFLFCVTLSVSASAWGILTELVSFNGNSRVYKQSFLYYMLTAKPAKLRVCVSTEGTSTDPARQKITRDYFVTSTQDALDHWLAFLRANLGEQQSAQPVAAKGKKKSKKEQNVTSKPAFSVFMPGARRAEFADILAALPRRIELQVINPNGEDCNKEKKGQYDLRIKSLGNFQQGSLEQQFSHRRGAGGGIKLVYGNPTWEIALPGNDDYSAAKLEAMEAERQHRPYLGGGYAMDYDMERVARHEIGHFLGLADQYQEYGMDKVRSLLRIEPKNVVIGGIASVMGSSSSNDANLTCDDLEGVINAMDFVLSMEGKNSPRLQNGWKSFCGKSYIYLQGIPAKNEADLATVRTYLNSWKQQAGAASQLVQLEQDWNSYLNKVEQEKEKRCDSLYSLRSSQFGKEFDKQGLSLSAECRYLTDKAKKIQEIIKSQIEPLSDSNKKNMVSGQQVQQLMQNLNQYKGQYTPGSEIMDPKGILTAKPFEDDFSPVTYPCLVCGKPVTARNGFLSKDVKVNGHTLPYHVHFSCDSQQAANYAKLGKSYQHKATKRDVPTFAALTGNESSNSNLLAQLGADSTPSNKKDTPVVAALPKAGHSGKGTASSKSAPVITGEYVGPKGAAVVPATPKTKTTPVAPQQPATPVAKPKPVAPAVKPTPAQPVKADNSPKAALDRYIATHPGLRDSLTAVRTGTALPTQAREVQEYQALFEAYKKGETPNPMLASAGTKAPSVPHAAAPSKVAQPKKSDHEAKRKELEAQYKIYCTLYAFDQKYEKELTPIRERLKKNKKLNQRQASLWKAYSQRLEQMQNWPHCKKLSAQINAL